MTQQTYAARTTSEQPGTVRNMAAQTTEAARTASQEVAETAKEQVRNVTGEVRDQAGRVAADVRDVLAEQARTQNDRLASGIRELAEELDGMAADREDTPARAIVTRIAESGRQVADYLAERGPDGVLAEVQNFARRRPGAFLATALVGGFVVGRLGKGIMSGTSERPARARGPVPNTMSQFQPSPTEPIGSAPSSIGTDPIMSTEGPISGNPEPLAGPRETGTSRPDLTTPMEPLAESRTR